MSDLSSEREAVLLRAADLANAADAWANRMRGDRRSIVAPEHAYALGIITRAELEEARARAAAPQGYRCAACKGVAHPATGHQWTPKTLVCRGCAERFFRWAQGHTRARGPNDFYSAATKWRTP